MGYRLDLATEYFASVSKAFEGGIKEIKHFKSEHESNFKNLSKKEQVN